MMIKPTLIALALLSGAASAQASVLPDLPVPFKYGVGVVDNQTIYIGLGSAGKAWYKLDTSASAPHWQPVAEFPGTAREQASAVLLNGDIYIFGGTGKTTSGTTGVLLDNWRYSPASDRWEKLLSNSPQGLVGHATFTWQGKAISMGGVNQNIFNGYFADIDFAAKNDQLKNQIIRNYFDKPAKDYFYNRQIISFDPATLQWSSLGEFPGPGTAGSALVAQNNEVTLINGEIKPGLRTPQAWQGSIKDGAIHWQAIAPVASPDGVAGAFSGISDKHILFAGGANFPGSAGKYAAGHYYAHEGLTKTYSDLVWSFNGKQWQQAGKLPEGIAYGVSLPWKNGLLLIGGETTGGKALASSILLTLKHGKLEIKP